MKEKNNKINETISNAIKNLTEIIDVNTVIGSPINEGENIIIPIAKVTLCLLSGGGEYGKVSIFSKGENMPYSAGNGSVVSIKPAGFLVKEKNDSYKVLSVSNSNLDGIMDKAIDFMKGLQINDDKE